MIGVGIISFDRPDYLGQLLASLEVQQDAPPMEYHLFQDGAVNRYSGRTVGDAGRIQEAIRLFLESGLSHRDAHIRHENVGVGINQLEAYDWMCEHYGHIVMLEDDVILSPYWSRLLPMLFDGVEARPDVFGFTTGFRRHCERDEINARLGRVQPDAAHWWMIAFTPDRWARIRPHYMRYYDLIRGCDYGRLPYGNIHELFGAVGWKHIVSSQDGGKDMSIWLAGMYRVALVINRGISIGREGLHFNPSLFDKMGLGDQMPYIFESDATRDAFDWPEGA